MCSADKKKEQRQQQQKILTVGAGRCITCGSDSILKPITYNNTREIIKFHYSCVLRMRTRTITLTHKSVDVIFWINFDARLFYEIEISFSQLD